MNHNPIHYLIGLVALLLAVGAHYRQNIHPRTVVSVAPGQAAKVARSAWPGLGMDKTIALGEALQGVPEVKTTIYCSDMDCDLIAHDIDDAMQIASWDSDFERGRVDAQGERGIFVGPPGAQADAVKAALAAIGIAATIADMPGPLGIIIGKRPL